MNEGVHNTSSKLNLEQRMILFEAMAKNHKILERRQRELSALRTQYVMWTKLVAKLNECGPEKNMDQWKKCWKDLRLTTKRKYFRAKKYGDNRAALADYEKNMIKACVLESSEDESDDHSKSETPQGSQSNSLEPVDEDVASEISEISDLEPSLYCPAARRIKLNVKQKRILLETMVKNHKIFEGRPKDLSTFRSRNVLWKDLTVELNKCGFEKSMAQWKQTWLDVRTSLRKKYIKSKKHGVIKLTNYEKRFIKVCGLQFNDEMSANHLENETPHGSQSNVVKLEPLDQDVLETSESSESDPESDCQEKKHKLNLKQKKILIEAMAENHKVFEVQPGDLSTRRHVMWKKLIVQLNECGPKKNMIQWKKSWNDLRFTTKKKYLRSKKYGGKRNTLADYEKYMIKACGLQSSDDDDDSDDHSKSESPHRSQSGRLEPMDEDASETTQVSGLDPSLYSPAARKHRLNLKQKKILIEAMAENHKLLEGPTRDSLTRRLQCELWKKLSAQLNKCGPEKNMAQWKRCFLDVRKMVKKKYTNSKTYKNKGIAPLTDYEKRLIKVWGLQSSDNETENHPQGEATQSNAIQLDPAGEGVSETFEISGLNSELNWQQEYIIKCESTDGIISETFEISESEAELNCHETNVIQLKPVIENAIPTEGIPEVEYIHGLNSDTLAPVEVPPLYPTCNTDNLNVSTPCDLQSPTLEKTDSSGITKEQILIEIRNVHETLLNESKKQTALLEKLCQSLHCW